MSGIVGLNFSGKASFSCHREACQGVMAAIAQQLPSSEEVEVYRGGGGWLRKDPPRTQYEEKTWCSYLITFNSTTAMEASDIQDFLRSKDDFSQHLSGNVNSSDWRPRCPVEVPMVSEPFKSFIAATTSRNQWKAARRGMESLAIIARWQVDCHHVVEVTIGVEYTSLGGYQPSEPTCFWLSHVKPKMSA